MRTVITFFIFILSVFSLLSCTNHISGIRASEQKFQTRLSKFTKNKNVILINHHFDSKKNQDTIIITPERFIQNEVLIVIPGINTFNFGELYRIKDNIPSRIDFSSCLTLEFITLKITSPEPEDYSLWIWGCHYGRLLFIKVIDKESLTDPHKSTWPINDTLL